MTEENKDSPPPKLRLSRKPKDTDAAEPQNKPEPKKASEPAPDLKLKRPSPEPKKPEPKKPEPKPSVPPMETPPESVPEKPAPNPAEEKPYDPENPFAGIEIKKPKKEERPPPDLPSKPAPADDDGSGQKVEEAISQIGEEKKSRGVLTSLIVIFILLAILGGAGFGLYYILKSPAETTDESIKPEEQASSAATEEASGGKPSGPIAKAKEAVANMQDPEKSLAEVSTTPAPEASTPEAGDDAETPEPTEAVEDNATEAVKAPSTSAEIDPAQTQAVSEFLQTAHIGGVRTGDRPKVILNGKSYNNGDLVDADTGLSFIGFRDKKLAFRDEQGIVYIKSF
ncbi:hypothetical protein DDZ13_11560 [Coraliomargarita sinensis]|uniref:Uncharacterized protein n=1 Tax=Coraliomargarita sinensis TaxID=2174842 RepID=A0A317ZEG1_9BACT|nr:hypothetical protein [Coraliomargarita sinensis]PXA03610.1 hypothetical protein DDZ13_11560 [Coraliomargarita sinensis]